MLSSLRAIADLPSRHRQSGGLVGDVVVTRVTKRNGGIRKPEYRLWALLPILPFMFVGLFIVGITFEKRLAWIGESSSVPSRYRNAGG